PVADDDRPEPAASETTADRVAHGDLGHAVDDATGPSRKRAKGSPPARAHLLALALESGPTVGREDVAAELHELVARRIDESDDAPVGAVRLAAPDDAAHLRPFLQGPTVAGDVACNLEPRKAPASHRAKQAERPDGKDGVKRRFDGPTRRRARLVPG